MDDDSDVDKDLDNSYLMDPHHGLDSSAEEGENPDDTPVNSGAGKKDVPTASGLREEHVSMLEEMVLEMKQGFQAAVEQLAQIQDKEDGDQSKQQQQQQKQLDNLTETVHEIKEQVSSLVKVVEQVQSEQKKLREEYKVLQTQVESRGLGPEEPTMMITADTSLEWTDDNPFMNENNHNSPLDSDETELAADKSEDNDEVTTIACRSISLTQALGEKCLEFNTSASSEDGEEPNARRASCITSHSSTSNKEPNRRHSMPISGHLGSIRSKDMERAAQRRAAVKELADSERDYCSQLWALLDSYLTPLQTTNFLTGEQMELLFPPFLERLYVEHCLISSGLQDKLVHWSYTASIANLLARVTDTHNADSIFSLYRDYLDYLPDAIACLRDATSNSADFKSFLKTIHQGSCHADDLMTLIIAPVQHLPKFLLQLQQICKYTMSTHPDYLLLQTTLNRLRNFVEQINEHINSAITHGSRAGSSNDSSQVLSARDSGVHSNEEEVPSARNFFRSEQNLSPDDWNERDAYYSLRSQARPRSSSYYHDQWQRGDEQRHLSSHMSALSQPDLTRFDTFGGLSIFNPSGPHSHIPRSQSGLPPTGANHAWGISRDGSGGRRKYRLRGHHGTPSDNPHLSPSPRARPSSAIDFTSGHPHHSQVQHLHEFSAVPARPRSAMAPLDPHHRPTIISRKHGRRSQPPVSNSGYWADNASTFHYKHSHSKMSVPPLDLLPSRPSPLPSHILLDDDEEDDTRASDSHSFVTSGGSHRHSSSHCSHEDRELDLDLHQALSESDHNDNIQETRTTEFSEEDVAASLAWKLCAVSNDHEVSGFPHNDSGAKSSIKILPSKEENDHRSHKSSSGADGSEMQSQGERTLHADTHLTELLDLDSRKDSSANNDTLSDSQTLGDIADRFTDSKINHNSKEKDQHNNTSNDPQTVDEGKDVMKNNRQFLLSLAQSPSRSPSRSPNQSFNSEPSSSNSKKGSVFSSTAQIMLKTSNKPEITETKVETTFSAEGKSSDDTDFKSKSSISHADPTPRERLIQRSVPSVSSQLSNGLHGSTRTSSPNSHAKDFPKSKSNIINAIEQGDNSSASDGGDKPKTGNTNDVLETVINDSPSSLHLQDREFNSDPEKRLTKSVDMSDLFISDDSKERRRERKKIRESSGIYHPSDSLPKANDDPVGARKKMHLKSSIKNLFTKKRGRVIMADVEREIILEMASEALTTAKKPPALPSNLLPSSAAVPSGGKLGNDASAGKSNCKKETPPSIFEDRMVVEQMSPFSDAFEMRFKIDQGNSTDSPLKSPQAGNGSLHLNDKKNKGNEPDLNPVSQTKSWFDIFPFSQKKSNSQTPPDPSSTSKKTSPSSQNKSVEMKENQNGKQVSSKPVSDTSNFSNNHKLPGLHFLHGQHLLKQAERLMRAPGNRSSPVLFSDVQQVPHEGKPDLRSETKSNNLDETAQQQHKKFQEQVKKYTKQKQREKRNEHENVENKTNHKIKEKEAKARIRKHKDQTSTGTKKSSEIVQCSNCQSKARKSLPQEQSVTNPTNPSNHMTSNKKNRNHLQSRPSGDLNQRIVTPDILQNGVSVSHNGTGPPTCEGMYVTFSPCIKPPDHLLFSDTSRNSQMTLPCPKHLEENDDEKKTDQSDTKSKTIKVKSKSNSSKQNLNVVCSDSPTFAELEKSRQNHGKYCSSLEPCLPLSDFKSIQNREMPFLAQISKSGKSNLDATFHDSKGHNGLIFSGSSLCHDTKIPNSSNNQGIPFSSIRLNVPSRTGNSVPESIKRRNGGEYNNLSLDVQANSMQADSVQKSYVKSVPWNGENIVTESPKLCGETQKTENVGMSAKDDFNNFTPDCATMLSSPSSNIHEYQNGNGLLDLNVMTKESQGQINCVTKQLSPGGRQQNWQDLLTNSSDYFNSKYRLCYGADDQGGINSTPLLTSERKEKGNNSNSPVSTDNPAYVAFVSYPSTSVTVQERLQDNGHKHLSSCNQSKKVPNGTILCPGSFTPKISSFTSSEVTPQKSISLFDHVVKEGKNNTEIVVGKTDPLCNGIDGSIISMPNKPLSLEAANGERNSANPVTNQIISSMLVENGFKLSLNPTNNDVYLPVSLADGKHSSLSPFTRQIGTGMSLSNINGNKASSVTKQIDYTKTLTNGFDVSPRCTATNSILVNSPTLSTPNDSIVINFPKGTNVNKTLNVAKENQCRLNSTLASSLETSAPKSHQKLFSNRCSAPEAQTYGNQTNHTTEECHSVKLPSKEMTVTSTFNKNKEAVTFHNSVTLSHLTSSSSTDKSTLENCSKSLSISHEMGECPPYFNSYQSFTPDDRPKANNRNSHPKSKEPNLSGQVFCVLPFGEYIVDSSAHNVPKSFSQLISEKKEQTQDLQFDSRKAFKEHKMTSNQKREPKNPNASIETYRYSSCSSHSANEIQILKLTPDVRDCSYKPNINEPTTSLSSHRENIKESEKHEKIVNALQVKYTPKSEQNKRENVNMTSTAPVNISSLTSTLPSSTTSDGISLSQNNVKSDPCGTNHGASSSMSSYANELVSFKSSTSGPDLLQVSLGQPGAAHKSDFSPRHTPTKPSPFKQSALRQSPPRQTSTGQSKMRQTPAKQNPSRQISTGPTTLRQTSTEEASTRRALIAQAPSNSQTKKQSFFARLAHSPLSFLHRDPKNATESK